MLSETFSPDWTGSMNTSNDINVIITLKNKKKFYLSVVKQELHDFQKD